MGAPHAQAIVFEHVTPPPRWRPPVAETSGAGFFFAQRTRLPPGAFAARFQIMLPAAAPPQPGTRVAVEVVRLDADPPAFAARRAWAADAPGFLEHDADHLMLDFTLEAETEVAMRAWASDAADAFRLRAVKVQRREPGGAAPLDWSGTHGTLDRWPLDRLRNVVVGNSGVCTASCVHCPTNKPWLPVPRGEVMPDRIFDRLVQGLVDCGLPIAGAFGFGLFADPLTDRRLAQRIRQVKAALPGVPVTVSTTGAAFIPRQAEVVEAADAIGVHVESLVPGTYERLMAPLRFDRVIPRVEALVRLAGRKARLSVPVHRGNLADVPALEAWWAGLGGGPVTHQPFSNRLSGAPDVLGLHLSPVGGACTQDLAYDLIVDWDGRLVNCCSDFAKESDLGSLDHRTLPELIADERRHRLFRLLRDRDWQRIGGCRTCLFDDPAATREAVERARAAAAAG